MNEDFFDSRHITYQVLFFQSVAIFFQKRSRLSSPPNRVVNMVESANKISPARSPEGGIHRNILNSRFPASINGWGFERSMGCRARTLTRLLSLEVTA